MPKIEKENKPSNKSIESFIQEDLDKLLNKSFSLDLITDILTYTKENKSDKKTPVGIRYSYDFI